MITDLVSSLRLKSVLPDVSRRWILVRQEMWDLHQLQLRVTDAFRTAAAQWALYSLGRKKDHKGIWTVEDPKKIVTHARAGESFHNYGLAIDSAFMGDDAYLVKRCKAEADRLWNEYGKICRENGFEWGGDWSGNKVDRPHCQITYGLNIGAAQMLYEEMGVSGVWDKCKQLNQCGGKFS